METMTGKCEAVFFTTSKHFEQGNMFEAYDVTHIRFGLLFWYVKCKCIMQ